MKEKLKTILLIILLILGLYLTQKVWIQFPEIDLAFFGKDQALEDINLLEGIIVPEKYLIHFGQDEFTLIYDDRDYQVFEEAKDSLKHILSSEDFITFQITNKEYNELKDKEFIEFTFSQAMNSHILSSSLNLVDLNEIVDEIDEIEKIFFSLDQEEFSILTNGEKHIQIEFEGLNLNTLKSKIDNIKDQGNYVKYIALDSDSENLYIPENMDIYLPELRVSNYIHLLDEEGKSQLAERFFSREIDYIREIVESNGSRIYEYDSKVLKLNSNGIIEYFQGLNDDPDPNLYISLSTAMDFLLNRIGINSDVFLSKVEKIQSDGGGYRLYFRYKTNQIPVFLGDEFEDYIQLEVYNDQIKSYRQLANQGQILNRADRMTNKLMSIKDIINKNNELLEESRIESIDISYFDPGSLRFSEKLQPVWIIETGDKLYVFDAYIGSLIYER